MSDDFTNTWLKVIKNPNDFFMQMPTKGGYADPIKFVVICYLIAGIANAIILSRDFFTVESVFIFIIMIPIIGVIGLFIGSLIFHIFFKILGGNETYEGTLRMLAYASTAPAVFYLMLFFAIFSGLYMTSVFVAIISGLYIMFLGVIGGIKVHKMSILNSVIATVVSVVISIVIIFYIIVLLYATINGTLLNILNEAVVLVVIIVILMLIVILLDAKLKNETR